MSIVCTPNAPRARLVASAAILCLSLLLSACQGGSTSSDATPTDALAPAIPTGLESDATATLAVTPVPTLSPALEALLAPGPTIAPPDGIFVQMGDDIWYQPSVEPARRVIEGQRIGPWAPTMDGARIALVRYRDENGQAIEEIVLINNDGSGGEVVYGPAPTSGVAIRELAWSWDGQALSAILSDNTIATMRFAADDPFRTKPPLERIQIPEIRGTPTDLSWAPSGAGIGYAFASDDGVTLYVTPDGDVAREVVPPKGSERESVHAFTWLPGRGRLAFVEAGDGSASHLPGSIFTITPDGQLPELLVSAGQFAPAATVALLSAGPDGRDLAFTVEVPDAEGRPVYQSLWILSIDSADLQQVPVDTGYRVADLAWTAAGLIWRGIDRNTRAPADGRAFTGDEPFVLGRFNPADGSTSIIFQSELVD